MNKEDIAEKLGISLSAISAMESGGIRGLASRWLNPGQDSERRRELENQAKLVYRQYESLLAAPKPPGYRVWLFLFGDAYPLTPSDLHKFGLKKFSFTDKLENQDGSHALPQGTLCTVIGGSSARAIAEDVWNEVGDVLNPRLRSASFHVVVAGLESDYRSRWRRWSKDGEIEPWRAQSSGDSYWKDWSLRDDNWDSRRRTDEDWSRGDFG